MTRTTAELLADRARLMGLRVPTFQDDPVHIVKGEGVWLWDADGRKFFDCYNNVTTLPRSGRLRSLFAPVNERGMARQN